MKITKITPQKNKSRYNIFIDGEYSFSLDEDTITEFYIVSGKVIDDKLLNKIKAYDNKSSAYSKALNYISYKPRTEFELSVKLNSEGFDAEVIYYVIERCKENGTINDQEFAVDFFEYYQKRAGVHGIVRRLREKGISDEIIENAKDDIYSFEKEKELAFIHYEKLLRKLNNKNKSERTRTIYNHLSYRGFDYDIIDMIIQKDKAELRD